jgi:hypothetical protein
MLAKSNNNWNSSPGVLLNDWTTTPAGIYQQEIFTTPPTTMI